MSFPFELKRSKRAKSLRVSVYPDGVVIVTAPYFFGMRDIERFIEKHRAWISQRVDKTKRNTVLRIIRKDIPILKKQAALFAQARCQHYADLYGVFYNKISIRAQKTRWGSCSRKGNLSFNYKIALLPPALADYIIVHEICHLIHFDHSKSFWKEVERFVPDHKVFRKTLHTMVTRYT